MSSTRVSVLVPMAGRPLDTEATLGAVRTYLASTGLEFEVLPIELGPGEKLGALLRRGAAEANGTTIVIVDADLPYRVEAIGDAVAVIDSASTDIVFGSTREVFPRRPLLRWLVGVLPDPTIQLKAFSREAARLVIEETKLDGDDCDVEIAFLANKYGFRVETLHVELRRGVAPKSRFSLASVFAALRVRLMNRRMGYRAARRCPVCFSNDIRTLAQISGNVVRICLRCKCRYLNEFAREDDARLVRRVLRAHPPAKETGPAAGKHSDRARQKTGTRRLASLRRHLTPRARVLEVGVRAGSFGWAAAKEFEYVGIDYAAAAVRNARAHGLEVYAATLSNFVNTGRSFDAVVLHHVFEDMPDPHDALARIKDLLRPGGSLFLTTFDTEGLLYGLSERKLIAQSFRQHMILYSRSALIELLEHSGFEIDAISPDFEYRDHRLVRHWIASQWPTLAPLINGVIRLLPDPMLVSSGSIRIVAQRRAGAPADAHVVRSAEPTHAR
jgi:2-polyprenyl-3-methyl-5-hydroxy-6-metoxy-1,4-benzoquinol methylase